MRYTATLSTSQIAIVLGVLLTLLLILFWLIPEVRRSVEHGKTRMYSLRALVSFGPQHIKMGGAFYRVSLYDEFLVLVFWGCTKIGYADIRNVAFEKGPLPRLKMTAHGVPVSILGNEFKLEELYQRLVQRDVR